LIVEHEIIHKIDGMNAQHENVFRQYILLLFEKPIAILKLL